MTSSARADVRTGGVRERVVGGGCEVHDCERTLLWVVELGARRGTQQLVRLPAVPVGCGQLTGAVRQVALGLRVSAANLQQLQVNSLSGLAVLWCRVSSAVCGGGYATLFLGQPSQGSQVGVCIGVMYRCYVCASV